MAKRKDSPTTANKKAERFNGETLRAAVTWAVDVQIFAPLKRHGNTTWQVVDLILLAVAWVLSNDATLTGAFTEAQRWSLDVLGRATDAWFAPEVIGLEHIPPGPSLVVGTHNGGNMAPDMFCTMVAFWRRFGVERAVERADATERRHRIAGQRLAIGVDEAFALRHAARVGVLDDGARRRPRRIELGDAFVRRVGVVDVVIGELLALHLARRGDAVAGLAGPVERRRLVRIFTVA